MKPFVSPGLSVPICTQLCLSMGKPANNRPFAQPRDRQFFLPVILFRSNHVCYVGKMPENTVVNIGKQHGRQRGG